MGLGFASLLLCAFFDFRRVETIEDKVKRVLMQRRSGLRDTDAMRRSVQSSTMSYRIAGYDQGSEKHLRKDHMEESVAERENILKSHQQQYFNSMQADQVAVPRLTG